jgi:putative Holliday junction resolvase
MAGADETILAFDFGLRRTGVAVGNTLTASARPLAVIEAESNERRFAAIDRLIREWRPQRLVVGRPSHPDGTAHEMTTRCERFARQLAGRFGLPVVTVDERWSSVEARAARAGPGPDDAEAAAVILRQYLSATPEKPRCD